MMTPNLRSIHNPPQTRAWMVVLMPDRSKLIARYSRVNHVWLLPSGAVVWPVAWYEDATK